MACPQAYEPPAFSKNACPWRDGSAKAGNCERTKSRSRRGSAITKPPDGRRPILRLACRRRLAMGGFRLAAASLPLGDSLSRGDLRERHANQELSIHGVTPAVGVGLLRPHVSLRDSDGPREQLRRRNFAHIRPIGVQANTCEGNQTLSFPHSIREIRARENQLAKHRGVTRATV